ncbi:cytochrome c oxidase assembly protein [Priestia megaterium]|uniref:SCO family protein n=1 Tax=Priestia megaterium TaxID=1404 RepID=UPI000BF56FAC|nr:SCO family protein [Priestia megaterium]PEZ10982.1 cytochrome c oxidase assembly protein [Priestia megaterium]
MKSWSYKLFFLLFISCMMLAACGSKIENPLNWKMDSFSYVNQDQKKVGLSQLKGSVWIANFIFTSCETVCPPMTAHMAKLQKMAKDEGLNVRFVSFSVDPEVDTPPKMKDYATKFGADFSNWDFLTGYKQAEIEKFALDQFKTIVKKPQENPQVIHGTDFFLIDKDGVVQKSYHGVTDPPYEDMLKDIKTLQ